MSDAAVAGLVSIVTPFHNAAPYLAEAIGSVRAQIYPQWELLLADDGSNDGSCDLAEQAAQQAPEKIFYLEHGGHAHRGTAATRNLALTRARGEFIAFLDADDVWLPHKLAEHVALLSAQTDAMWVAGRSEYFQHDGSRPPFFPAEAPAGFYEPPVLLKLNAPLGSVSPPPPSALMLRRSVLEQIGGFEESFTYPDLQYLEDQAFLSKLYLAAAGTVVERSCTRYRRYPESYSTRTMASARDAAERHYFAWLRAYLRARHVDDPDTWRLIEERTWSERHPVLWALASPARRVARWLRPHPA